MKKRAAGTARGLGYSYLRAAASCPFLAGDDNNAL
jgi:hypothetical protein